MLRVLCLLIVFGCQLLPCIGEAAEESGMLLLPPAFSEAQAFQRLKPQLVERRLSPVGGSTRLKAETPLLELLQALVLREQLRGVLVDGGPCPDDVPAFQPLVQAALDDLLYLEYDKVLSAVARAPEALLCGSEITTAESINQYFLIQAALQLRAKKSAEPFLTQALLLSPDQPLPQELPQALQSAFLTVKDKLLRQAPRGVTIQAPRSARLKLWINARPVEGAQVSLRPGKHLLQWVYDKKVVVSRWIMLEEKGAPVWPPEELKLPDQRRLLQSLYALPEEIPPPESWRRTLQELRRLQGWQWLVLVGGTVTTPSVLLVSERGTTSLVLVSESRKLGLQPELNVGALVSQAVSQASAVRVTSLLNAGVFWPQEKLEPGLRFQLGHVPLEVESAEGARQYVPLALSLWVRTPLSLGEHWVLLPGVGYGVSTGMPRMYEGCLLEVVSGQELLNCQTTEGELKLELWRYAHGPQLRGELRRALGPGVLVAGLGAELHLPLGEGPARTDTGVDVLVAPPEPRLLGMLVLGYGYAF